MNVTVLLAHPDDEIFCAGTISRFVAEGHAVALWTLFLDAERRAAFEQSIEHLQISGFAGGIISEDVFTWNRFCVRTIEDRFSHTDLLISHRVEDPNTSHGHLGRIARTLARKNRMSVWEIDAAFPGGIDPDCPAPNHYVDISPYTHIKEAVIDCYPAQITPPQRGGIIARDQVNGALIGVAAAEAFRIHKSVWL